jgi:hypothetical protein
MLTILDAGDRIGFGAVLDAINRAPVAFSHQYLAQLSVALQETLIGTAQTLAAFRIGPTDAKRLAPEFFLTRNDRSLVELTPHTYHLRTAYKTQADQPLAPLDFPTFNVLKLVDQSRHEHARPRAEVEASIDAFLDGEQKPRKTRNKK